MLRFLLTWYENSGALFERGRIGSEDSTELVDERVETWDEMKRVGRSDRRDEAAGQRRVRSLEYDEEFNE